MLSVRQRIVFFDAYACHKSKEGKMYSITIEEDDLHGDLRKAILSQDNDFVCSHILSNTFPRAFISVKNLHRMTKQNSHSQESAQKRDPYTNLVNSTHPRPELPNPYVAPRNKIEKNIANIWQEFLQITEIGIHDDYFSLGGNSLRAMEIVARLRETFQIKIPNQDLFQAPTVAEIAKRIKSLSWANKKSNDSPMKTPVKSVRVKL